MLQPPKFLSVSRREKESTLSKNGNTHDLIYSVCECVLGLVCHHTQRSTHPFQPSGGQDSPEGRLSHVFISAYIESSTTNVIHKLKMSSDSAECLLFQSTALSGNIFLYFAEVIMLTLALVLHAIIKHRILGHLFYTYVFFFSSDIFSSVHSYSESFTQCLRCHEALLFSQGCSPVVRVADYVGVCSPWASALSLRLTQQHRRSAPQHSADGCQETKETDISELLLSYGNNVHL